MDTDRISLSNFKFRTPRNRQTKVCVLTFARLFVCVVLRVRVRDTRQYDPSRHSVLGRLRPDLPKGRGGYPSSWWQSYFSEDLMEVKRSHKLCLLQIPQVYPRSSTTKPMQRHLIPLLSSEWMRPYRSVGKTLLSVTPGVLESMFAVVTMKVPYH